MLANTWLLWPFKIMKTKQTFVLISFLLLFDFLSSQQSVWVMLPSRFVFTIWCACRFMFMLLNDSPALQKLTLQLTALPPPPIKPAQVAQLHAQLQIIQLSGRAVKQNPRSLTTRRYCRARHDRDFLVLKLWFLCVPWGGERSRGAGDVRRSERACARRTPKIWVSHAGGCHTWSPCCYRCVSGYSCRQARWRFLTKTHLSSPAAR